MWPRTKTPMQPPMTAQGTGKPVRSVAVTRGRGSQLHHDHAKTTPCISSLTDGDTTVTRNMGYMQLIGQCNLTHPISLCQHFKLLFSQCSLKTKEPSKISKGLPHDCQVPLLLKRYGEVTQILIQSHKYYSLVHQKFNNIT